jgi:hypothetical protein
MDLPILDTAQALSIAADARPPKNLSTVIHGMLLSPKLSTLLIRRLSFWLPQSDPERCLLAGLLTSGSEPVQSTPW